MAFDSPFLISKSSIGERQSVGGESNLTFLKAETIPCASSAEILFGLLPSANPADARISRAARILTPEKLCLRKEVIFLSSDSLNILCRDPSCIP